MIPWRVLYTFVDRDLNEAQVRLHFAHALAYAAVEALALTAASALRPISDAKLKSMSIVSTQEWDYSDSIPAQSNVGRLGFFAVSLENGNYSYVLVPSILQRLEVLDDTGRRTYLLEEEDSDLVEFLTLLPGLQDEYGKYIEQVVLSGVIE